MERYAFGRWKPPLARTCHLTSSQGGCLQGGGKIFRDLFIWASHRRPPWAPCSPTSTRHALGLPCPFVVALFLPTPSTTARPRSRTVCRSLWIGGRRPLTAFSNSTRITTLFCYPPSAPCAPTLPRCECLLTSNKHIIRDWHTNIKGF